MPRPTRFKADFRRLDVFIRDIERATSMGGLAMAEGAFRESQKICPVATGQPNAGFLKRSGRVEDRGRSRSGADNRSSRGAIIYDANYSAKVHNTNYKYRHGQWMFVREPLMDKTARLEDAAREIKKAFA